ncbi:hypothetical protein [Telluribacter sp.]|uniref:hypothetical protein n=1 Tax=Telluribacter sp. TaxID=1978767 RepID=UPI002E12F14B|nr:hypothetical protein [Telluribacter sp.]
MLSHRRRYLFCSWRRLSFRTQVVEVQQARNFYSYYGSSFWLLIGFGLSVPYF